jgi:hypothetical protein
VKRPHLLRVRADAASFERLAREAGRAGWRLGWLQLGGASTPDSLGAAVELPTLRAVAVDSRRTVAVKALQGPPVLEDLLREHFLGCRLVLVRGEAPDLAVEAAWLEPAGEDWRLVHEDAETTLTTVELVRRLARPKPLAPSG